MNLPTVLRRSVAIRFSSSTATQIAENIVGVSAAAGSTTQALTQTRTAVDELSRMASDLRTSVGRFTYGHAYRADDERPADLRPGARRIVGAVPEQFLEAFQSTYSFVRDACRTNWRHVRDTGT